MDLIYSTSMKGEGPDKLCWRVRVLRFVGNTFPSSGILAHHLPRRWCGDQRFPLE